MSGFNQEKVRVVYYRALYPFEARSHDEISIQPGDIVMVSNHHKKLDKSRSVCISAMAYCNDHNCFCFLFGGHISNFNFKGIVW